MVAVFISENFELVSLTLSTRHMTERHTGAAIMNEFQRCLEEFDMVGKEVCAVTDAGSNMKRAASLARTEHHLCVGHGLHNLVIKDGFGSVPRLNDLLVNCRDIVKTVHYRASDLEEIADSELNAAVQSLVSTAEALEHDENDPVLDEGCQNSDHAYNAAPVARGGVVTVKLDTPTRWHSILAMFESLVANKAALRKLLARLGRPFPCVEDWCLIEEIVQFLSQFKCAVELLSQQKSSTLNVLIVIRSELLASLQDDMSGSSVVRELKREMLERFERRFPLTDVMVTASLLDPRFQNLKAVEEYVTQRGTTKLEFLAKQVRRYIKERDVTKPIECDTRPNDALTSLARRHSSAPQHWTNEINAECHALLSKPCAQVNDALKFWKGAQNDLPWLSCLAKKILCIPATSTPSERVFSVAGLVLRSRRANLHPLTVDKLLFIHDNYSLCKSCL